MKKRPKLYLVGHDPANVFDNLDKLRTDIQAPPHRRPKVTETFARIPHDKALALYRLKISRHAWAVLFELDRAILKAGGQNPIQLWSGRLRAVGLHHQARARALWHLERAGVIMVKRQGSGRSPWVFHTWYPKHPS